MRPSTRCSSTLLHLCNYLLSTLPAARAMVRCLISLADASTDRAPTHFSLPLPSGGDHISSSTAPFWIHYPSQYPSGVVRLSPPLRPGSRSANHGGGGPQPSSPGGRARSANHRVAHPLQARVATLSFLPNRVTALAAMSRGEMPASCSCHAWSPWSMFLSGRHIARTFRLPSRCPLVARYCSTCEPKPPMLPSSTMMSAPCSFTRRLTRSVSSGLQNRASATVAEMLCSARMSAASEQYCEPVPKPRSAMSLPWRRTRPFPISRGVPLRSAMMPASSRLTPCPLPLG
mmetsp:Transcript_30941/g.67599  ORF Transcript_30941/g.67599 Transcript_30941/m.67599 type:complete len:288 (-) Transcript_30941:1810-2673(-)